MGGSKVGSAVVALAVVFAGCEGVMMGVTADGGSDSGDISPTDGATDGGPPDESDAAGDGGTVPDGASTTPDADAEAPAGRVPIFVAQGMVGRSTISCDDGRSWVADRAWDTEGNDHVCGATTPIVCGVSSCDQRWYDGTCGSSSPCDCGHSPGFSKGVVYADGAFVGTWGWGWPGSVMRSTNGVDWTVTHDDDSFGGIAYGAGRFVVASRDPYWSADGVSWTAGETADFSGPAEPVIWSVRRFAFADYDTGRFVAVASGNVDRDVLVSSDGGETWWRPSVLPDGCGSGVGTYGGIVYGNGVIAMVGDQSVCRSVDGGETWSLTRVIASDDIFVATPVFTGAEFLAWSWSERDLYRSSDAETWTRTHLTSDNSVAAVARNPVTGTLVATANFWNGYDSQRFLRSSDGVSWESLPSGAFNPSHPIFHIAFGYAEPSSACP